MLNDIFRKNKEIEKNRKFIFKHKDALVSRESFSITSVYVSFFIGNFLAILYYFSSLKSKVTDLYVNHSYNGSDILPMMETSSYNFYSFLNETYSFSEEFRVISSNIQGTLSSWLFVLAFISLSFYFVSESLKAKRGRDSFEDTKEEGFEIMSIISGVILLISSALCFLFGVENFLLKIDNFHIFIYGMCIFLSIWFLGKGFITFSEKAEFVERKILRNVYSSLKDRTVEYEEQKTALFNSPADMEILVDRLNSYQSKEDKQITLSLLNN